MAYGDAMGYLPFREAIAEYLGAARGVRCEASQILVTTGSQQALQISAQVLLDPKDRVWMEEPGYPGARPAFMTVGAVLTDFIRQGHFARHIRRMRMLYMERRRALVNAIQMQMGEITEVIGTEAGMHLVALLPSGIDDVAVCMKAAQKAVSAIPLSTCYLKPPTRGGLILGYGGANAHQIHDGIRKLRMSVSSRIA
jgi:DNA-binding transcriptional MocR family regulator